LPLLTEWTDAEHAVLADLGYEGKRTALTTPIKKITDAPLTDDQRTVNLLHAATRGPAERGNSLLKTAFKALRRVSLCPGASAQSPPPPSPTPLPARPNHVVNTEGKPLLGTAHSQR
jgi:hypothetical protein